MDPQKPSKQSDAPIHWDTSGLEDATNTLRQQRLKLNQTLASRAGPLPALDGLVKINNEMISKLKNETDRLFLLSIDLLAVAGMDGFLKQINPAFQITLGYTEEELLDRPFIDFVHPMDRPATMDTLERLKEDEAIFRFENRCQCRNGIYKWIAWSMRPLPQSGHYYMVGRDSTRQVWKETQMTRLSVTDELTGLFNRRGFNSHAEKYLKMATRQGQIFMLSLVDLDKMKTINDQFGHAQGDVALQAVTSILNASFRGSDIIARIGGDEFAVCSLVAHTDNVNTIRNRVQQQLKELNQRERFPFTLAISIGFAASSMEQKESVADIMSRADQELYKDKDSSSRRKSGTSENPTNTVPVSNTEKALKRALVIDDVSSNRKLLRFYMHAKDFQVELAEDGEEALNILAQQSFDVILVDLNLPKIDGITVIREIRSRPWSHQEVPVIVVTAFGSRETRDDCLAAGANVVLLKPINLKQLDQDLIKLHLMT